MIIKIKWIKSRDSYNGIFYANVNERTTATCNDVDESQKQNVE